MRTRSKTEESNKEKDVEVDIVNQEQNRTEGSTTAQDDQINAVTKAIDPTEVYPPVKPKGKKMPLKEYCALLRARLVQQEQNSTNTDKNIENNKTETKIVEEVYQRKSRRLQLQKETCLDKPPLDSISPQTLAKVMKEHTKKPKRFKTMAKKKHIPTKNYFGKDIKEERQSQEYHTETEEDEEEDCDKLIRKSRAKADSEAEPANRTSDFPSKEAEIEKEIPKEIEDDEESLKVLKKKINKKESTPITRIPSASPVNNKYEFRRRDTITEQKKEEAAPGIVIKDVERKMNDKKRKFEEGKLKKKAKLPTPDSTNSSSSSEYMVDDEETLCKSQKKAMEKVDDLIESMNFEADQEIENQKSASQPETSEKGMQRKAPNIAEQQLKLKSIMEKFSKSMVDRCEEVNQKLERILPKKTQKKTETAIVVKERSSPRFQKEEDIKGKAKVPRKVTFSTPQSTTSSSTPSSTDVHQQKKRKFSKKERNDSISILAKDKKSCIEISEHKKESNSKNLRKKFVTIIRNDGTRLQKEFHTGCTTKQFVGLEAILTDRQKEDIIQIGFASLLYIRVSKLPDRLLMWLVENFDPFLKIQTVGSNKYYLSIYDVHDILGLSKEGINMNSILPKKADLEIKEKWMNEYNKKPNEDIFLKEIFTEMMALKHGGEKFIKLFVIYSVSAFLAPTARKIVDFRVLSLVEDLEKIKQVNWSEYILEKLCSAVAKYKRSANTTQVSGCVAVLLLAYLYRFPIEGKIDSLALPLIRNWDDDFLMNRVKRLTDSGFHNGIMVKKMFPLSNETTNYSMRQTFTEYNKVRPSSSTSKGVISYSIPADLQSNEEIISSNSDEKDQSLKIFYRDMEIIVRQLIENLIKAEHKKRNIPIDPSSPTSPETQRILNDPKTHELVDRIVENFLKRSKDENEDMPSFDLGLDDIFNYDADAAAAPTTANIPAPVQPTSRRNPKRN